MDDFYELSDDTIDKFFEVFNKKSFPVDVKFQFAGARKQKELIKVQIIPPKYAFVLEKEIFISMNEDLVEAFDVESVTILIEQEIDKVYINMETGKIKLVKTDLNTFSSLVNKYGVDAVSRANQVMSLYNEQKKDGKIDKTEGTEFII